MVDFVKLNGTPVRATGLYRRQVAQPDGPAVEEVNLVVILRGRIDDRAFLALIAPGQLLLEFPGGESFEATAAAAAHASSGADQAAAHRHDLTLRETNASAERRARSRAAATAANDAAAPTAKVEPDRDPDDEIDGDPAAAPDFSTVDVGTAAATWGTAVRQLTAPQTGRAEPRQAPLAPVALAGVEAVLVGLRLEALIETLDHAGAIRRSAVDDAFLRLIDERFVAEATPVVGETVAQRVVKELLDG